MKKQNVLRLVEYLNYKGYSKSTVEKYSKAFAQVPDDWDIKDPATLYEHIKCVLRAKRKLFLPDAQHNIRAAASQWFQRMTGISFKGYGKCIAEQASKFNDLLSAFVEYSINFKNMTELSAIAERNHIQKFLESLESLPDDWSIISAECLKNYICTSFSNLSASSKGRYVTSLRNFFRFLEYKGNKIHPSVLTLPLRVADWANSKVPIVLSSEEESRLRAHYRTGEEQSIRNRIIVLLMLDLGLRCSEVSVLELADIRWTTGEVHIRSSKTHRSRNLPLSREIEALLENYIINYRPRIQDRHVFLRKVLNGHYSFMTRECVRSVIRRAFTKEGIHGWWKGTHSLRRTAASRFYASGNGLKLTADLLGHESLDSTKLYVKVDFDRLREAASPWPGGDSNE